MKTPSMHRHHQIGASLIEVLVALLLLSLGMLSLAATLSFAVQMPKLSGYRATATTLASAYIERMRANPGDASGGFSNGDYNKSSYDGSYGELKIRSSEMCDYPTCDTKTIATMDFEEMQVAVRAELPAGGIVMQPDSSNVSDAGTTTGNLWIIWQEPDSYTGLDSSSSADNCPLGITVTDRKPRCLYVRFRI